MSRCSTSCGAGFPRRSLGTGRSRTSTTSTRTTSCSRRPPCTGPSRPSAGRGSLRCSRRGGTFAAFGGPLELADDTIEAAADEARSPYLSADDVVPPGLGSGADDATMSWPGNELEAADLFTDVRQVSLERRLSLSADDYVGHLATISAYLVLAQPDRVQALAAIRGVLPERVDVVADITLHLARLR